MKKFLYTIAVLAVASFTFQVDVSSAQDCGGDTGCSAGCDSGACSSGCGAGCRGGCRLAKGDRSTCDRDGMTEPVCPQQKLPRILDALHDPYSPHPFYAHSSHGNKSAWTHVWNQQQANTHSWHGNYNYWRFGAPTALVVPPTAAFHTTYNWGVGQTTSRPIYHQFGMGNAGGVSYGGGAYANTPYWPSSTDQFGVYPVRGPWGGN